MHTLNGRTEHGAGFAKIRAWLARGSPDRRRTWGRAEEAGLRQDFEPGSTVGAALAFRLLGDREANAAFDNSLGDGVPGKTGNVVDVKLAHEVLAMFVHRFEADTQFRGDLFVGLTFGNELEHLYLPGTEAVTRFGKPLAWIQHPRKLARGPRVRRAEEGVAFLHCAYGGSQHVRGGLFEQESCGTQGDHLLNIGVIAVRGENQHLGPGKFSVNLASGFQTIELGHGDVHQDDSRPEFAGELQRFPAGRRFSDHLDIGFVREQRPKAFSDEVMVFSEEDSNSVHNQQTLVPVAIVLGSPPPGGRS